MKPANKPTHCRKRPALPLPCRWLFASALAAAFTASAEPVTNVTFVSFDVETTALSTRSGRIIEIGAVKFRNGDILERRCWLINPGAPIPENSRRIHGITEEMVANVPPFTAVFPQFADFVKDSTLIAHNAGFDVRFLNAELERTNLPPITNHVLDTLKLARAWFPDAKSYKLQDLIKRLGKDGRDEARFHRALADSRHVARFFIEETQKKYPNSTLEDLSRLAGGALRLGPGAANAAR